MKDTKETFDDILIKIRKNEPEAIRLEKMKKIRTESLKEFLSQFFIKWNNEKDTIFVNDKELHTIAGLRRSLSDIYLICEYYYPDCTLEKVIYLLYDILPKFMPNGFRTSFCYQQKRRMWYFDSTQDTELCNSEKEDEFGYNADYYLDKIEELKELHD